MLVALNPLAGLQLYVAAPLAVSVTLPPEQIVGFNGNTLIAGGWVSVMLAVAMHAFASVTVTVYVPAVKLLAVAALPPLGVHAYV
jgi:hypothetical protein